MTESVHQHTQHRRPHQPPMAAAFLEFDLDREIEQLQREPEWRNGQNARTLVKYDDFRIVLTALKAHVRIPAHQTDGRLSINLLRGRMQIRASGRTFDLPEGKLLVLDRDVSHDLEALEDCAFLLTIARPVNDHSRLSKAST